MSKLIRMSVVAGIAAVLSLSAYASGVNENATSLDSVNSAVPVETEDANLAEVKTTPEDVFGSKQSGLQLASSCGGTLPRYSMLAMVWDAQDVAATVAAEKNQCSSCSATAANAGQYYVVYCI